MLALAMVLWMKVGWVCWLFIFLCIIVRMWYLKDKDIVACFEGIQFDFYLAGGMRGYENKNKDMFLKVATLLREEGWTVFNPGEVNDDGMTFNECMCIDLNAVINQCDAIAFLPGWKDSLGSNAEAFVAFVCGKPAFQTKLIHKETEVRLKRISLKNYCLPYKTKRRS